MKTSLLSAEFSQFAILYSNL